MPKLIVEVAGKGNGMRTVIINMQAVAESLRRPPSYPIKYIACELGVMSSVSDDQCVINGSHKVHKLTNLLYDFIGKFILCEKCETPETTLANVNGEIYRKCDLCGHEVVVSKTKVTKFILNNLSAEQDGSKRDVVKAEKSTTETIGKEKNESLPLNVPVNTKYVKYLQDFILFDQNF